MQFLIFFQHARITDQKFTENYQQSFTSKKI